VRLPSDLVLRSVGLKILISTKLPLAEVRTRVVVGSVAASGSQRTCSRMEILGAML